MMRTLKALLISIEIVLACGSYKNEKLILDKLLTGYNTDVRPETSGPVPVHFHMKLKKIAGLDIKKQILKIDAFIILRWKDPQLVWNETDYTGTDRVNIGNTLIWTPDVVLYNTADDISHLHTDLYTSKCLVFNHGQVIMRNLVKWKISCSFDVTWFPVDKQVCNISFGSWSYSESQLKVKFWSKPSKKEELLSNNFRVDSGEWVINSLAVYKELVKFECCPEGFSSIIYKLTVSRKSLYYFMYILLPLISLAFLFLLVFHIPPDSGERMGFGVTILLSITVYLLVISEKLPEKSDKVPMLGLCFIVIFYVLCTALAMAALTTILSRRDTMPPYWIMKLTSAGCFKIEADRLISKSKVNNRNSTRTRNRKFSGFENNAHDFEFQEKGDSNASKTLPIVVPKEEEGKTNYNAQWAKICRSLDKKLFIVYNILIIITPIIITVSLPTVALGTI